MYDSIFPDFEFSFLIERISIFDFNFWQPNEWLEDNSWYQYYFQYDAGKFDLCSIFWIHLISFSEVLASIRGTDGWGLLFIYLPILFLLMKVWLLRLAYRWFSRLDLAWLFWLASVCSDELGFLLCHVLLYDCCSLFFSAAVFNKIWLFRKIQLTYLDVLILTHS